MAKSFRAKASTTGDRHSCFPSPTAARISSILSLALSRFSGTFWTFAHSYVYYVYASVAAVVT